MRLLIYARTSGSGDGEDSLDAQCEHCRSCAVALGHEIVGEQRDEHVRGALPAHERPGLMAIVLAIESGAADGFIVHRLDRLARELRVQEAALAQAWAIAERVAVFEAPGREAREVLRDDIDESGRTFARQILGAAAQYEKGVAVARMRNARRRKAERGGWIGGHRLHPRYGYIVVNKEYVPVADEQAVIARMYELREARATYRAIADTLSAEGVAPPASLGLWHYGTVRRVLVREGLAA